MIALAAYSPVLAAIFLGLVIVALVLGGRWIEYAVNRWLDAERNDR